MVSGYYVEDNSNIDEKKLDAANRLYVSGDFSGALKIYLDVANASYSYKLYYEIGRCYYKLNNMSEAVSYFSRSIALVEEKNPSYIFLGNIVSKQGDIQKAIRYWLKSYSYKPDDEIVCLNLASSYFSMGMKFQAMLYYDKYLRFAKDKTTNHYNEIKNSISEFEKIGREFYDKGRVAMHSGDNATAITAFEYAAKNIPIEYDIVYTLAKLYFAENNYEKALFYAKQSYCIDSKSIDVLQLMSKILLATNDYKGAYCCYKRMMPLVLNNQREYLVVVKAIKQLEEQMGDMSSTEHIELAKRFYGECHFHFSLFEYENCRILSSSNADEIDARVDELRAFLYPEERIINVCMERGGQYYSRSEYSQSNKYFTKIMNLSKVDSSDYKYARSRIKNI